MAWGRTTSPEQLASGVSPEVEAALVQRALGGDADAWARLWEELATHVVRPYLFQSAPVALLDHLPEAVTAVRVWFEQPSEVTDDACPRRAQPSFDFLRKALALVSKKKPWDQQLFRRQVLKWTAYGVLTIAKLWKSAEDAEELAGPALAAQKNVEPVIPIESDAEETARLRESLAVALTEFFALTLSLRDVLVMSLWAHDPRSYKEAAVCHGYCGTPLDAERVRRRAFESAKYWLEVNSLEDSYEVTVGGPDAYRRKLALLQDANRKLRAKRTRERAEVRVEAEHDVRRILEGDLAIGPN